MRIDVTYGQSSPSGDDKVFGFGLASSPVQGHGSNGVIEFKGVGQVKDTNVIVNGGRVIVGMPDPLLDFNSLFSTIIFVNVVFTSNNGITAADSGATMSGGQNVILVQDGSSATVESGSRLPRNLVFEFSGSGIVTSDNSAVNSRQCTDGSAVFNVS